MYKIWRVISRWVSFKSENGGLGRGTRGGRSEAIGGRSDSPSTNYKMRRNESLKIPYFDSFAETMRPDCEYIAKMKQSFGKQRTQSMAKGVISSKDDLRWIPLGDLNRQGSLQLKFIKDRWGYDHENAEDLRWVPPRVLNSWFNLQWRWLTAAIESEEEKDEVIRMKMACMDEQGRLSHLLSTFMASLWYNIPKFFSDLVYKDINWYYRDMGEWMQSVLLQFSNNWVGASCLWPWLCYYGEYTKTNFSGKIKDDLRWVSPWYDQGCLKESISSNLSKVVGFPLVQAEYNDLLCLEEVCLELVVYIDIGKAKQCGCYQWKIAKGAIPTREGLWRKRCVSSPTCPLCKSDAETLEHLLLLCERAHIVWFGYSLGLKIDIRNITRIDTWMVKILHEKECNEKAKALIACMLWKIWKTRYAFMVKNKFYEPMMVIQIVTELNESFWNANGWNKSDKVKEMPDGTQKNEERTGHVNSRCADVMIWCDEAYCDKWDKADIGVVGVCLCLESRQVEAFLPFMTEALVVLAAFKCCVLMGLDSVKIMLDCLALVQAIKNGTICPKWESLNIVGEIYNLGKAQRNFLLEWISRKSNQVANWCARLAMIEKCSKDWVSQPPSLLTKVLAEDWIKARKI